MGACATKPKVLVESKEAPAPAPAVAVSDPKDVVMVEGDGWGDDHVQEGGDKVKEIVEDDKADEQGNKRRSLSHLFMEHEENSNEDNKSASEPIKEEAVDTGKAIPWQTEAEESPGVLVESETKVSKPWTKSQDNVVADKATTTPEFVDALEKIEPEKVVDATSSSQTQIQEDNKTKEPKPESDK